jgi:hypothetical protein
MLQYLQRANRGPLSQAGVAQFHHDVLALMKHELQTPNDPSSAA